MLVRRWQLRELNTRMLSPFLIENPYKLTLISFISHSSLPLITKHIDTMGCFPYTLLLIFSLLLMLASSSASYSNLPPEIYWHAKLPNTEMPSSIRDLLSPSGLVEGSTVGTPVDSAAGQGNATVEGHDVGAGIGGGGHGSTNVDVGHGGVDVNTNHKGKPVTVRVYPGLNPFQYGYASPAAVDELLHDPAATFFFREEDLHHGARMWLRFTKPPPQQPGFLPRRVANTIPFSSASSSSILRRFSIDPRSAEAIAVRETLKTCELPAAKGEEKRCATSMEDMVDFVMTRLGTNHVDVLATTTSQKDDDDDDRAHQYIVESEVKVTTVSAVSKLASVTCHRQPYVYAVYYCHETYRTKLYVVDLVGDDEGRKAKAVAVCHEDTSTWNTMHMAFMVLHEKPGSGTVCHLLPQDHLVWIPSITSNK